MPTQIILPVADAPPMLAGLPAVVRAAREIRRSEPGPIYFCVHQPASDLNWRDLALRVPAGVIAYNGSLAPIRRKLATSDPLLVVSSEGLPAAGPLVGFLAAARQAGSTSSWIWDGRTVAVYYPDPEEFLRGFDPVGFDLNGNSARARPVQAAADSWKLLNTDQEIEEAERELFKTLRSDSDGYLARWDRSISIPVSRRLVHTSVTPNQITTITLFLGILGAVLIAQTNYALEVLGAALLWICCVLDGCDGEVARLKLLSSPAGARYDVTCDNVSHIAVFCAVAAHLYLSRSDMNWPLPAFGMLSGVVMSMFTVWRLILRQPEQQRPAYQRVFERIASRDYMYLIFALVVTRHLDWFLWAVAVGSHVFWIVLWLLSLTNRPVGAPVPMGEGEASAMTSPFDPGPRS